LVRYTVVGTKSLLQKIGSNSEVGYDFASLKVGIEDTFNNSQYPSRLQYVEGIGRLAGWRDGSE
jgi:hypothetical protein